MEKLKDCRGVNIPDCAPVLLLGLPEAQAVFGGARLVDARSFHQKFPLVPLRREQGQYIPQEFYWYRK